ncbi:PGRP2 amidase, partial [Furnarius figulus]|nr:PGRP2 amidase [Furnarius figulus]
IVAALESPARGGSPGSVLALARALGVCSTPGCRAVLGEPPDAPPAPAGLPPEQWRLLEGLLGHDPSAPERGVVLAPDGSSVALGPLLAGIEVGLRRGSGGSGDPLPTLQPPLDPLLAVTLAEALGTSFLLARSGGGDRPSLGPDGCWDDVDDPQNYTLMGPPSLVPDAVANGAMDGAVLGARLAREPVPLAELLRGYYGTGNGSESGRAPSSRRRSDFGALAGPARLEEEVVAVLEVLRVLPPTRGLLEGVGQDEVRAVAARASREFTERYVGPPWGRATVAPRPRAPRPGVAPGTPHHSMSSVSRPARSARTSRRQRSWCSGWPASFVVGSDGYLYEGRGWHWVGAHTKGYNTKGFGVSFVGDFSSSLPDADSLALVRDQLVPCAVRTGRILPNYTLHGHRQLGRTLCPGNALFQEIQSWPGFQ